MAPRSLLTVPPKNLQSRVTNRKRLLSGLDGRSRESRRWRDLVRSLSRELGREPSESELTTIRLIATATVTSEAIQVRLINGTAAVAEIAELGRLGNVAMRGMATLGLKGHPKDDGALRRYLDAKAKVPA